MNTELKSNKSLDFATAVFNNDNGLYHQALASTSHRKVVPLNPHAVLAKKVKITSVHAGLMKAFVGVPQ